MVVQGGEAAGRMQATPLLATVLAASRRLVAGTRGLLAASGQVAATGRVEVVDSSWGIFRLARGRVAE